jgi:nucleotide-binding universal stress UspA family protein
MHPFPLPSYPEEPTPADLGDDGGDFRRILVPIDSEGASAAALDLAVDVSRRVGGSVRLVYLRLWEPPLGRGEGYFCAESSLEATQVLQAALEQVWAEAIDASGVVIDARRQRAAAVLAGEAVSWGADVVIMTRQLRRFRRLDYWEKVAWDVMALTSCPVLVTAARRP